MTWQVRPLGELCEVLDSKRKPITKRDRVAGDYPYYGATGILDHVTSYIFDEDLVLLGEDGAKWGAGENSAFIASGKYWVNNHAHVLRPLKDRLDQKWLVYFLNFGDLMPFVSGLTVPKLNQGSMREIQVPVPPLPEQYRIVALLDEAFAGIAIAKVNAEKSLHNAQNVFDRHLSEVFTLRGDGWARKQIADIAEIKGGKRVPKGYKLEHMPTGFPYLRVTDFLDSGTVDTSDLRYISKDIQQGIKNYIIRKDDLYISIAGTIGKTGIIPAELDGANLTENACRLVFREGISNRYVYHFTTTREFLDQVGANTRTAAQPKLALSRLATIELSLPALKRQIELADSFDELSSETRQLQSLYTRKLGVLDELKQSLLHQAFSGQL